MGDAAEAPGGIFLLTADTFDTQSAGRKTPPSATIGRVTRLRRSAARVPSGPLLEQFRAAPPGEPTPAEGAIRAAAVEWFHAGFLDTTSDATLAEQLTRFADAVLPLPFHRDVLTRRVRLVR